MAQEYIDGLSEKVNDIQSQVHQINEKTDRNHRFAIGLRDEFNERLVAVEQRHPGHSDEEIVKMIDDRLEYALSTSPVIRSLREDVATIRHSTDPLIDIHKHVMAVNKALRTAGRFFRWTVRSAAGVATLIGLYILLSQFA